MGEVHHFVLRVALPPSGGDATLSWERTPGDEGVRLVGGPRKDILHLAELLLRGVMLDEAPRIESEDYNHIEIGAGACR